MELRNIVWMLWFQSIAKEYRERSKKKMNEKKKAAIQDFSLHRSFSCEKIEDVVAYGSFLCVVSTATADGKCQVLE